ncbi:MAG TPA: LCP family protein [Ilumatobacteraceae bacterium]|nr:LCP family protein [Ilumatobacteraceae bacterium]
MLAIDTSPRRRPRRWPAALALTLIVALVGTGGLLIAARRTVDKVGRISGLGDDLNRSSGSIENFLMVGSDSRAKGDPNTGVVDVSGGRSDTIMVLRRDKKSGDAALLSIPRDLYVEIPGHGTDRINSAYGYSPQTLLQTVRQTLDLPIHHYIEVDFSGFKDLVDAIGGVNLCFLIPTRDGNTGLNIPEPGCYHMDGTAALGYARSRHYEEFIDGEWREDPTSDLGRTKRQRAFINTALTTALASLKTNPMKTGELITAIGKSVSVDSELDPIAAGSSLRSAMQDGVVSYSLPVTGKRVKGKDVLLLGENAEETLAYFRGTGPAPAADPKE